MYTYQMKVKNNKGWIKTVYVTAENYLAAVKKMKAAHGNDWIVHESNVTFAQ